MLFSVKKEKPHIAHWLPVLLLIGVLILFSIAANDLQQTNASREKTILSSALDRSITQCYALEGFYPPNLSYLEDHYGLTYNKELFFVDYQYIGDNLRPDITIIERGNEYHD